MNNHFNKLKLTLLMAFAVFLSGCVTTAHKCDINDPTVEDCGLSMQEGFDRAMEGSSPIKQEIKVNSDSKVPQTENKTNEILYSSKRKPESHHRVYIFPWIGDDIYHSESVLYYTIPGDWNENNVATRYNDSFLNLPILDYSNGNSGPQYPNTGKPKEEEKKKIIPSLDTIKKNGNP